jgi:hypothetical protein
MSATILEMPVSETEVAANLELVPYMAGALDDFQKRRQAIANMRERFKDITFNEPKKYAEGVKALAELRTLRVETDEALSDMPRPRSR